MPGCPSEATYKPGRRAQSSPHEPAPQQCVPAQGRGEPPVRAGTGPQASTIRPYPPALVPRESRIAQSPACTEGPAPPRRDRAAHWPRAPLALGPAGRRKSRSRALRDPPPSLLQPELRPRSPAEPRPSQLCPAHPSYGPAQPCHRATPLHGIASLTAGGGGAARLSAHAPCSGRPCRCLSPRWKAGMG